MKKIVDGILTSVVVITLIVLGLVLNPISFSTNQKETLLILLIVCGYPGLRNLSAISCPRGYARLFG